MPPALLLTAGLGTRLRPLTLVRAKAAVPIGGEALVRRIVRWLVANGVTDLVLNLHHLPATITAVLGDGSDLGARVRYSWERPIVLGSAGGPKLALPIVGADTFFIVNGDTLADLALAPLLAAHRAGGSLVTLALVPNREHLKYGGVRLDDRGRVTGFVGRGAEAAGSYHFIGVQVAEASAFAATPASEPSSSIGGAYDRLIATRRGTVSGFVCDASFFDIGTIADYWVTSQALAGREAAPGRNVRVDPTARVGQSILWDDVEVGAGATLDDCIVTDGVAVPAGQRHRRTILIRTAEGLSATRF